MDKIKAKLRAKKLAITVEEPAPKAPILLKVPVVMEQKKATLPEKKKAKAAPSPLQLLGNQRNWERLQVIGAIEHLEKVRSQVANYSPLQYTYQNGLQAIKSDLLKAIDKKWETLKLEYLRRVEEEAFAAYPRSYRGSPEQINKRLEIIKAQEEF